MYRMLKLFLILLFPICLFALPIDQEQPMHITANSSVFNFKTGSNIYEGAVKVDQGTSHLTADRLITNNNNHKIEEAIAYGINIPAEYSTLPKAGDAIFY